MVGKYDEFLVVGKCAQSQRVAVARACDYSSMTLPTILPKGQTWMQNVATREYELVNYSQVKPEPAKAAAEATVAAGVLPRCNSNSWSPASSRSASFDEDTTEILLHAVQPTDTLAGICIAYKVSAKQVRQANHGTSDSLLLAHKTLRIPILNNNSNAKKGTASPVVSGLGGGAVDPVAEFMAMVPSMTRTEAKAYLQMADGHVLQAVMDAQQDLKWEQQQQTSQQGGGVTADKKKR